MLGKDVFPTQGLSQHRAHLPVLNVHPHPHHPSILICLFYCSTAPFVMQIWWLNDGENTHAEKLPDSLISTSSSGKARETWAEIFKGNFAGRFILHLVSLYVFNWTPMCFWCMCSKSSWMIHSNSCYQCGSQGCIYTWTTAITLKHVLHMCQTSLLRCTDFKCSMSRVWVIPWFTLPERKQQSMKNI